MIISNIWKISFHTLYARGLLNEEDAAEHAFFVQAERDGRRPASPPSLCNRCMHSCIYNLNVDCSDITGEFYYTDFITLRQMQCLKNA